MWVGDKKCFVHGVLKFLEPNEELSVVKILEDNKEAIALLGKNAVSSSNSKHVRHHS